MLIRAFKVGVLEQQNDINENMPAACLALILGLMCVFIAGFAPYDVIHHEAHDVRHSLSFPCH